jgi:hypothetical protein
VLLAIAVCLLIAAASYALKPYALNIINTADDVILGANILHVIAEYFLILGSLPVSVFTPRPTVCFNGASPGGV